MNDELYFAMKKIVMEKDPSEFKTEFQKLFTTEVVRSMSQEEMRLRTLDVTDKCRLERGYV